MFVANRSKIVNVETTHKFVLGPNAVHVYCCVSSSCEFSQCTPPCPTTRTNSFANYSKMRHFLRLSAELPTLDKITHIYSFKNLAGRVQTNLDYNLYAAHPGGVIRY
jgi:hypothetical protein